MIKKLYSCLLVGFLLSLAFIACSRPADTLRSEIIPVSTHSFTRGEVTEMLITNYFNINGLHLTDGRYIAPEKTWVESIFTEKMSKFLFDHNLNHWIKESWDCDKITRTSACYAGILFHNSSNRIKGHGFLVGEFYYLKTGKGGHAINICIVKDGKDYRIMFYEPQLKYEVTLTQEEKFSAFMIKF